MSEHGFHMIHSDLLFSNVIAFVCNSSDTYPTNLRFRAILNSPLESCYVQSGATVNLGPCIRLSVVRSQKYYVARFLNSRNLQRHIVLS